MALVQQRRFHRVVRRQGDAGRDEFGKHRAGQCGGGQADDQRIEHRATDIGAVGIHRQHRRRMRRYQTVDNGKPGHHRQTHQQQRHAGAAGDVECDGNQQHEADFKKDRQADAEGDQHHRPVHVLRPEAGNHGARDAFGAAGFGHHLAEHGAQRDDQRDMAQRLAHALFVGRQDLRRRHAGQQGKAHGNQRDADEGIEAEAGNQHDQRQDRQRGVDQQQVSVGHAYRPRVSAVRTAWKRRR
ncbi:hypothetical protein D3C81_1561640 [compost metagenome]